MDVNGHDVLDTALRDSSGGRVAAALAAIASRAWASSRLKQILAPLVTEWPTLARKQKIRAVAIAVAVAMVVERSLTVLLPRPADPLSSVLPLTVLVASVVVAVIAGSVAQLVERLGR